MPARSRGTGHVIRGVLRTGLTAKGRLVPPPCGKCNPARQASSSEPLAILGAALCRSPARHGAPGRWACGGQSGVHVHAQPPATGLARPRAARSHARPRHQAADQECHGPEAAYRRGCGTSWKPSTQPAPPTDGDSAAQLPPAGGAVPSGTAPPQVFHRASLHEPRQRLNAGRQTRPRGAGAKASRRATSTVARTATPSWTLSTSGIATRRDSPTEKNSVTTMMITVVTLGRRRGRQKRSTSCSLTLCHYLPEMWPDGHSHTLRSSCVAPQEGVRKVHNRRRMGVMTSSANATWPLTGPVRGCCLRRSLVQQGPAACSQEGNDRGNGRTALHQVFWRYQPRQVALCTPCPATHGTA